MTRTPFRFQRFAIEDDQCGMKIGTDAVLLGAWTNVDGKGRILDIGTGCGLIALMLSQRTEGNGTPIDAIDQDENAALQAAENVANSPWPNRIKVSHQPLQQFASGGNEGRYDLCVCNPPFFTDCSRSSDPKKSVAKHTDTLSHKQLFSCSQRLLQQTGKLSVILPYDQLAICLTAQQIGFYLHRQTSVRPLPAAPFKRVLLEFGRQESQTLREELVIESARHQFSPAYEALTSKFHLRFANQESSPKQ